jgi:electron transfer flavoprotein alpha subunit
MSRLLLIAFSPVDAILGSGFATELGLPFDIVSFSGPVPSNLGAEAVLEATLPEVPAADVSASAIGEVADAYTHIASVSNMRSKDVLARLAGILDCGMITDVLSIESPTVFKRPVVAGSIIATVETLASPIVITFRPAGFKAKPAESVSIYKEFAVTGISKAVRIGADVRGGSRPDLTQAKVIVSGGRPLKDSETFETVIGGLADALGGAVGATRAAVDAGIAANELQVGQTGKIVAPDLYIAAGISGSTQHMAGIKDSKIIVAINKDPDAPIFDVADYGLVADLFEAIPAMRQALDK